MIGEKLPYKPRWIKVDTIDERKPLTGLASVD
jgi:hypothetical protein